MIAKDKEDIIIRALDSTEGVFDGYFLTDTGSTDNTVTIFQEWCEKHSKHYQVQEKQIGKDYKQVIVDGKPTLGDFSSPRNDNFQMARDAGYDYAFWMDSDDIIENAKAVPDAVELMRVNIILIQLYRNGKGFSI